MDSNSAKESPIPKKRKIRSPTQLMSNELQRLASFQNFPMQCPMYPIRLAQAGYYYQDKEDEVICYACHTKHKDWSINDIPIQVHINESENCTYVKSHINILNVNENSRTTSIESGQDPSTERYSCKSAASGGDKENRIPNSKRNEDRTSLNSIKSSCNSKARRRSSNASRNQDNNCNIMAETNTSKSSEIKSNSGLSTPIASTIPGVSSVTSSSLIRNAIQPLGVITSRPRYPKQAILALRQVSFTHWPSQLNQKPEDLAKAGLFYEGINLD